jgi:hypothetical protein
MAHALVGYRWQYIGLCPGFPVITAISSDFVSHLRIYPYFNSFISTRTRPVKPTVAAETAVEKESRNEEVVSQTVEKVLEKPVQLVLPMEKGGEESDEVKEGAGERPETKPKRKRRPGRPGAGRRRWRR